MRLVEGGGAAPDDWLAGAFDLLAQRAAVEMTADGYPSERVMMQPALDMRYKGQSHELTVRLPAEVSLAAVLELFHTAHEQRYGYRQPEEKVEIVTVRLTAVAAGSPPEFESQSLTPSQPERALIGRKEVWFNQRPVETNQYDRSLLQPGDTFEGAAVIYQYDTTTVIPPDWRVRVDLFGNLVVEVVEEEG
jgi:N-methylhydantoinase A